MRLSNGRQVAVHTVAEGTTERTVVLCHIAPGAGEFDPDPDATWAKGVTLLSVDRPGYGGSDPVKARSWATVAEAADDLAEVLDELGVESAGVAGWSAGGRVALALAARRPDLVDRLAVISTPAPDEEVPWLPPEEREGLEALRGRSAKYARDVLTKQMGAAVPNDPRKALPLLGVTDADKEALGRPYAKQQLEGMLKQAFAQGPTGMVADIAGYCLQPWGFDLSDVRAKTLLFYGAKDPIAGPKHGKWYKQQLADARFSQVPDAGHLAIMLVWSRVLSHLAPHCRRT
jgi:pimeloyl-ACP methyl ester carboxylesterase